MRALYNALAGAAGISILAACSSGQSAIEPPSHGVDVQNTTVVQFRVGTARHATGAVYLNTLTTYRQPNGLSATLYNTPTITGPAGFVVPAAGSAGTDAGTNHISGTPPTQPGTPAVATTFGQTGGVFAYGFAPANSTSAQTANYSKFTTGSTTNNALYSDAISAITTGAKGNTCLNIFGDCTTGSPSVAGMVGAYVNVYTQPFFVVAQNKLPFLIGPPAVPDFHNPSFPAGFMGYDSGFTFFAATPVAGTYTLNVTVPSANIGQNAAVFNVSATLPAVTALPAETPPTIAPASVTANGCGTGASGGGATFVVAPGPAGVTNQLLYIVDVSGSNGNPTHYTFSAGAAGGTFTLSPTAGPSGVAPFCSGDTVNAWVVGSDYDILALAPPGNLQQSPTLPATADITVSLVNEFAY